MITVVSCENKQSVSGGPAILHNDPKVKLHQYDRKIPTSGVNSYGDVARSFQEYK